MVASWGLGPTTSAQAIIYIESKSTTQALNIATKLKLDKVTFEGDAQNVILTLHGLSQFGDWEARKIVEDCQKILTPRLFWFLNSVSRRCNATTHTFA